MYNIWALMESLYQRRELLPLHIYLPINTADPCGIRVGIGRSKSAKLTSSWPFALTDSTSATYDCGRYS